MSAPLHRKRVRDSPAKHRKALLIPHSLQFVLSLRREPSHFRVLPLAQLRRTLDKSSENKEQRYNLPLEVALLSP